MSQATGQVTITGPAWDALVAETCRASAEQAANITARRAGSAVRSAGRVNTGRLADSFRVREVVTPGNGAAFEVYTDVHYWAYQNYGTRGSRPVNAKVLRFRPKGGGGVVFAMHTGPIAPAYFMESALRQLTLDDFIVRG